MKELTKLIQASAEGRQGHGLESWTCRRCSKKPTSVSKSAQLPRASLPEPVQAPSAFQLKPSGTTVPHISRRPPDVSHLKEHKLPATKAARKIAYRPLDGDSELGTDQPSDGLTDRPGRIVLVRGHDEIIVAECSTKQVYKNVVFLQRS